MTVEEQSPSAPVGKLTANRAPERTDLSRLIEASKEVLALMGPDEKAEMYLAQRQSWTRGEMGLDRKPDGTDGTRLMAAVDENQRSSAEQVPEDAAAVISRLSAALRSAQEEFNRIACEGVTETRSVSDAFDRAKVFANRGAVAVRGALSYVSVGGQPVKVDASDIGRALRVLIVENPEKHRAALEQPSLRGWFVGQFMKKFEGKVDQVFVGDLIETVFEFTAPLGVAA